ncbi:MAG: T9SS type A sorting domain-containing protein [Ignavibacteriae bacterium]|nr:T9SS C-terminal target domain-containing protein [Ignavibacteriota bacterium]NOG99930.1 T9SS type A sorting domain-containing protein [Ignavibacteriota bacterium]
MKNKIIATVTLLIISAGILFSQQSTSIHKLHRAEFGTNENLPSRFDHSGKGIIPLDKNKIKNISMAVFGYLPDWEYNNGAHQFMRYDLLTHVACFDFVVAPDGSVSLPSAWPWTDVINAAHQNGTKVILTAVNFDRDEIRAIITSETAKNNFFNEVKNLILTYSMDGVNIDFESLYNADKGSLIVNFMSELTSFIHSELPGKEVSFAGPAVNWGDYWDLTGLAASCDYIFIMGYSFAGKWSTVSGANSPLVGGSINITKTITEEYGEITASNPDKIILGIPYYGHHWITIGPESGSPVLVINDTLQFMGSTRFNSTKPQSFVYGNIWSTRRTPYFTWNDGQWHQVWHDDDSSLGLKYDLAQLKNLRGVGMWALGYDKGRNELWDLIDWKFGSGEMPSPEKPYHFAVLAENDSSIRLIYDYPLRATGFKIYQSFNGVDFTDSFHVSSNDVLFTGLEEDSVYYYKLKSTNQNSESDLTEVLAAIPSNNELRVLIVNGYDRTSGTNNTRDFIRKYSQPFIQNGYSFSSADNEAIFKGKIPLQNADIVYWMLGDESTSDESFNTFEQNYIKGYLDNGGKLFISGSEVGWDLGRANFSSSNDIYFYENYLKAEYKSDAPNGSPGIYYTAEGLSNSIFSGIGAFNFDDGTHGTFDVDYPDEISAINGSSNILKFSGIAGRTASAGVSFNGNFPNGSTAGKLIYITIPFETIYPLEKRTEIIAESMNFFNQLVSIEEFNNLPEDFTLYQNYPNPFNPATTIKFSIPVPGNAVIKIYNTLGELINQVNFTNISAGEHSLLWNAENSKGEKLSTGIYVYSIEFNGVDNRKFNLNRKMILLK